MAKLLGTGLTGIFFLSDMIYLNNLELWATLFSKDTYVNEVLDSWKQSVIWLDFAFLETQTWMQELYSIWNGIIHRRPFWKKFSSNFVFFHVKRSLYFDAPMRAHTLRSDSLIRNKEMKQQSNKLVC